MNEYYYYVDEKISLWRRTYFKTKAENEEAADEKVKSKYVKDEMFDDDIDIIDSDYLYDTEEPISVEMNGGQSTIEVYSDNNDKLLYKDGE